MKLFDFNKNREPVVLNARIKKASLPIIDGTLRFNLTLEYQPGYKEVNFGNFMHLEFSDKEQGKTLPSILGTKLISKVLHITEAGSWEALNEGRTYVRLKLAPDNKIDQIGHIIKDRWMRLKDEVALEKKVDTKNASKPSVKGKVEEGPNFRHFITVPSEPNAKSDEEKSGSGPSSDTAGDTEASDSSGDTAPRIL